MSVMLKFVLLIKSIYDGYKKEGEKYKISMDIRNCCFHSNIIKACDVKVLEDMN